MPVTTGIVCLLKGWDLAQSTPTRPQSRLSVAISEFVIPGVEMISTKSGLWVSLKPSGGEESRRATSRLMKTCIKFMSTFNNLSNSRLAWQGWATDWYGGSGRGYWAGKQTIDAINDIGAAGVRAQHFLVCYVFIHLLFFSLLITINCCSVFQLARGLGLAGPGLEHFF